MCCSGTNILAYQSSKYYKKCFISSTLDSESKLRKSDILPKILFSGAEEKDARMCILIGFEYQNENHISQLIYRRLT
jgi:hypothetical protein